MDCLTVYPRPMVVLCRKNLEPGNGLEYRQYPVSVALTRLVDIVKVDYYAPVNRLHPGLEDVKVIDKKLRNVGVMKGTVF